MRDRPRSSADEALKVSAADRLWLERLWSDHARAVWAYAARRSDPRQADEIVADTFAVLWRRRREVPEPTLPWLYGVARRVLADRIRTSNRQSAVAARLEETHIRTTGSDFVDDLAESASVLEALLKLPREEQEAVKLTYWEGLNGAQAAIASGCSRAAFSMRLMRGRRRLRSLLQGEQER